MSESQNIEYKESWRDEYLKWVCGFANAHGGTIYIGARDDGEIVGVTDSKKLMEDIPNKIKDMVGIVADVNLLTRDDLDYIEIKVSPSTYPVSYKGEYHYRSGSTKQQYRGAALTEFIMQKTGYRWDAVPVDNITVDDLDPISIDIFKREAVRKKRMSKTDLDIPTEELMEHLDLMIDGKLKRAAVMLFYKKPGKIITGCYVKVGKFGKGPDLQYQDTVEGSIFSIADRVIDLIFTKYLKAKITYEHDVRVETYPFPREGVREAIYNALGHNNYAASIPIQIRIEDEAMYISNSCILPPDWTVDTLLEPHKSVPFNPSIASVFFRAGYIEAWGRGVQLIYDSCSEMDAPAPEYKVLGEDLTVKFTALPSAIIPEKTTTEIAVNVGDVVVNDPDVVENDGNVGKNVGKNVGNIGNVGDYKKIIIDMIIANNKVSAREIAESMSVTKRTVERYIKELREEGCLVRHGATHGGYWEVVE